MSDNGFVEAVEIEKEARAEFLRVGEGWAPTSDDGKRVLNELRMARKALQSAAETGTVREAYEKAGYVPNYAKRGRKPKAV